MRTTLPVAISTMILALALAAVLPKDWDDALPPAPRSTHADAASVERELEIVLAQIEASIAIREAEAEIAALHLIAPAAGSSGDQGRVDAPLESNGAAPVGYALTSEIARDITQPTPGSVHGVEPAAGNAGGEYDAAGRAATPTSAAGIADRTALPPAAGTPQAQLATSGPAAPATITVSDGDCLWCIAERHYGSGFQYRDILDANRDRIGNPDLIYPGQVLILPEDA